jgi:hypothetical protein
MVSDICAPFSSRHIYARNNVHDFTHTLKKTIKRGHVNTNQDSCASERFLCLHFRLKNFDQAWFFLWRCIDEDKINTENRSNAFKILTIKNVEMLFSIRNIVMQLKIIDCISTILWRCFRDTRCLKSNRIWSRGGI